MTHRDDERALDLALLSRLAADEGGPPPVAERDLDLGDYTIRTRSNHTFDYADPRPEMIRFDDMLHGLLCEARYAGQVPRRYSVAEHLVLAVRIAEVIEPDASIPALYAVLMHDAAEGFVKDLPGPLKRLIGEPYRVIERAVEAAIFTRYRVDFEPHRKLVKECDRLAYLTERSVLCGWKEVALPGALGRQVVEAKRLFVERRCDTVLARALPWPPGPWTDPAHSFRHLFRTLSPGGTPLGDDAVERAETKGSGGDS